MHFTLEAFEASRSAPVQATTHFERDPAVEREVFGQVDFAHSTGAKLVDDAVVGERLSGLQ